MNDLEREIRETLRDHEHDAPTSDRSDAQHAAARTRRRQIVNVAGVGLGTIVIVIGLVVGLGGLVRADRSPTVLDIPSPSQTSVAVWSPVQERGTAVVWERGWQDPTDASLGWVDVRRVQANDSNDGAWTIDLVAKPPLAAGLEPGLLISYGLVFDTTGDGVADYVIGIDNDAPERGDFHVWVSDLATGETDEQIGPPYGSPIEFSHPDEGPPYRRSMHFTFLGGTAPADLDPQTVRFYAWAYESRDGEVIAWDTAPDTGWMAEP